MDKESIRLVMTGTHPNGQGGISAVVTILLKAGLFEHFTGRYVVSHVGDGFWRKLATGISAPWRMFHTCRVFRPSIVHAHCSIGASFVRKAVLLSIARRWGAATVLHLHSGRFREFAHDEAGWLRRLLVRRVLRRSSAVIALSDGWAGIVRELAPTANVHVIANAVAVPATPQAPAKEPFRILFLGQVGRHKGVYDLVEAVARLKNDFPRIKLIIGGDGELAEVAACARRHGVAEHVELLGWVDSKGKEDELRRAGLFCLPSYG
jgi:glycosyltransferase involved in cell wall biosynthesis